MKKLIYKNEQYWLCDEKNKKNGQTCVVSNYTASKNKMPHKKFDKNIVVYARAHCPYCISLVKFLKNNNKTTGHYDNLIYIDIDNESPNDLFSINNIFNNLKKDIKDHETVPIVFHNSKFIGGCDDSKIYFPKL